MNIRPATLLLAIAFSCWLPEFGRAATFTWDGGGTIPPFNNNNWLNLFNWDGNVVPPNDGTADVLIPDTPRDNPVVDLPWSIDTLEFQGGGNYSLSGQPLTIANDLTHFGTGAVTINNTIVVPSGSSGTWRSANGPIAFNGAITGGTLNFILEAPQPITFDGTALNTFSEEIKLLEGTLILSKPATNGAIAGDLSVGTSSGDAATAFWDNSEQVSEASGVSLFVRKTGVANLNGKLETLDGLFVEGLVQSTSGKLTVLSVLNVGSGEVDIGAGELVLPPLVTRSAADAQGTINASLVRLASPQTQFRIVDVDAPVDNEINATIADSGSGPSELRKMFGGVLRLTGANTYTGGTRIDEGTLRVDNTTGSATGPGSVTVFATGRLDGNGAISGPVVVSTGGVFAPGSAIGSIEVGLLSLAAGSQSQFQINGTTQGSTYDFADVTGAANLGGDLTVILQNPGLPMLGAQTFTILSAATISGSFSNVASGSRLVTLDRRGSFLVSYGAGSPFNDNEVVLSSFHLAADFDGDGDVDGNDLGEWKASFGVDDDADADIDGDSDGADLLAWQRQLGATPIMAAATTSVPEPATRLLVVSGALAMMLRGRVAVSSTHAYMIRSGIRPILDLTPVQECNSTADDPPRKVADAGALALHEHADAKDPAGYVNEHHRRNEHHHESKHRLPPRDAGRNRHAEDHEHWRRRGDQRAYCGKRAGRFAGHVNPHEQRKHGQ